MTSTPSSDARKPSKTLLAAAMTGLFAVAVASACSTEDEDPGDGGRPGGGGEGGSEAEGGAPGTGGSTEPEVFSRVLKENATEEDLVTLCNEREGWLYKTAFCSGSGHCRGLFLLGGTLSEYSCKGMNGCGGMGCVDMPEDQGRTGKEVYEKGGCENCHGKWAEDYSSVDMSYYQLIYPTSMTAEEKMHEFEESSVERLMSIMIFGTQGFYADGTPYSNMPSYRDKYSREEIKRAVEHVRGLEILTASYEVPGGMGGATSGGH